MSNSNDSPPHNIKNPIILSLLESLKTMPEYIAQRHKRIMEKQKFHRKVWEKALTQAGLIKVPLPPITDEEA